MSTPPKNLQAFALALRELQYANELTRNASNGTYDFHDLLMVSRNGVSADLFPDGFVPDLLVRCAVVASGWANETPELETAANLFEFVLETTEPTELQDSLDRFPLQTALQVASLTARDSLVERLRTFPQIPDEHLWATLTDQLLRQGASGKWIESFNRPFREGGGKEVQLMPVSEANNSLPPLDNLFCPDSEPGTVAGPLITIIVSVYKPDYRLLTAVKALTAQTWKNIEILVVDDGSPASAAEPFLNAAESLDPRVRLIRSAVNAGSPTARNIGLREAKGDFVTYADADDWTHPERLARQVQPLLEDPTLIGTFSNALRTSNELAVTWLGASPTRLNRSSLFHRRNEILEKIGYHHSARIGFDSELIKRIETVFGADSIRSLNFIGGITRLDPGSLSRDTFGLGWRHPSNLLYVWAMAHWHKKIAHGADPFLAIDAESPFPVPLRFRANRDAEEPGQFDVVLVSSAVNETRLVPDVDAELAFFTKKFERVGVLHRPHLADNLPPGFTPAPSILDGWFDDRHKMLNGSEQHHCQLMLVRSSQLASPGGWLTPEVVIPEKILVVVDSPIEKIVEIAASFDNLRTHWLAQSKKSAEKLRALGLANVITTGPWGLLQSTHVERPWIPRAALLSSLPRRGPKKQLSRLRRLAGGELGPKHAIWENPALVNSQSFPQENPPHLVDRDAPLNDVLLNSGIAVFDKDDRLRGGFNAHIIRAMALGCVPLVAGRRRGVLGDSVLYRNEISVDEALELFTNDPEAHRAQVQRGHEFIESHFSTEKFESVIDAVMGAGAPPV